LQGTGRWISEFEASLAFRLSSRKPGLHRETLFPKNKKQKKKEKRERKKKKKEKKRNFLLCN
jgi:CRISPR/Cas system CSM-associated protein Csm4 (group 5 of RAMP superfamily)